MRCNRTLFVCIPLIAPALCGAATDHVQGQILVQATNHADNGAVTKLIQSHAGKVGKYIPELNLYVVNLTESAADNVARLLSQSDLVTFAERDGLADIRGVPNDPDYSLEWHLGTINAAAAWNISTGSTSVPIAMIDSGIDPSHPDLAPKLIPGWNFLLGNSNTADDQGHGTATAGTLASATDNGIGIAGVVWQNPIMPLVVVDSTGYASYSNIATAIIWAANHGARVINISISGTTASSTLQSAVNYAFDKGVVIVAAAGNGASSAPMYPAACNNVIAVSATEPDDTLASFSSYGSWIDVSAPGDNIFTANNSGSYSTWYGTSFSSPITAAAASLILSINPSLSPAAVTSLLENNSDDIGAPGFDTSFGWGRIDLYKAALAAEASLSNPAPPAASITSPVSGTIVSGLVQITGSVTDSNPISQVQLWVDGTLNSSCAGAFICTWNTAGASAGNHSIVVHATDSLGNIGSATTSLSIQAAPSGTPGTSSDTTPPTVQITSPTNGATVTKSVTIKAAASDNVQVAQVCIYVDNVLKATLTSSPYNASWNTNKVAAGSHIITAKAWDVAGNTATSSVTVSVK